MIILTKERNFVYDLLLTNFAVRYNFSRTLICPECGGRKVIEDNKFGAFVCTECGCVVEGVIDRGPEWRSFDREERERVGAPQAPTSVGISTVIGRFVKDAHQQREQIRRLQKWHRRLTDRSIVKGISEIKRTCSQLDVPPSVRERVAFLYRQIRSRKPQTGRKLETIIAALTYWVLRETKISRPLKEIAKATGTKAKEVAAAYRALRKEGFLHSLPAEPIDFIPRLVSELGLSGEIRNEAIKILKKASATRFVEGKNPVVMAATAVYIAANMHKVTRVSQKEVANAAGVTEVSIRNHYKELIKMMGFTLNVHKGRKKFQPAFFLFLLNSPNGTSFFGFFYAFFVFF